MAKQQFKDSKTYTEYRRIFDARTSGNITADQLRAEFETYIQDREAHLANINTLTKDKLQMLIQRRIDKKEQGVHSLYENLLQGFLVSKHATITYSYDDLRQKDHLSVFENAVRKNLAQVTDAEIQAEAEERRAKTEKKAKALSGQLEDRTDYEIFIRANGEAALNDEQLEVWDSFIAYDEDQRAYEEVKRAAQVSQIKLAEGIDFQIKKGWHDKRQCEIWIVSLSERVDRIQWKEIDEKARKFGTRWSSWGLKENHGWIFYNEADAAAFMDLTEGDGSVLERWEQRKQEREQNAALRLADKADNLEESAEEELARERKTNTVRRAGMAQAAWEDAARDKEYAQVLRSIGEAIGAEKTVFLRNIRYGTQVELLEHLLTQAKYERIRAENNGSLPEKERDRPVTLADIRYVKMPWPVMQRGDVSMIVSRTEGKRGMKPYRNAIAHLANTQNKEQVTFSNWSYIDYIKQLADTLGTRPEKYSGAWYFADAERLRKLGVKSLHYLRALLREYLLYRKVKPIKVDEIRIKELNLVGLKIAGFFPTPVWLADKVVGKLDDEYFTDDRYLEPNGGSGRLCDALKKKFLDETDQLDVCEINWTLRELLTLKGYNLVGDDFMEYNPGEIYRAVVMNPPFENNQDVKHVQHAFDLVVPGGQVVAIMGKHWTFSQEEICCLFRDWLDALGAEIEDLPEGTFKESGTNVPTVLITIYKPN